MEITISKIINENLENRWFIYSEQRKLKSYVKIIDYPDKLFFVRSKDGYLSFDGYMALNETDVDFTTDIFLRAKEITNSKLIKSLNIIVAKELLQGV